jgi:hypothetical protein
MANERLLFKFYRSYFDVAQELNDKERLEFYDALMKRQFFGIEPNLKGIVKLAYISQKHNIDAQVKGWQDKMDVKLLDPTQGGGVGGSVDPTTQVEEKEKEKEKEEVKEKEKSFLLFWNLYEKKVDKVKTEKAFLKLSETEIDLILSVVKKYVDSTPDVKFRKNPLTWLNGKCWNDVVETKKEEMQFSKNFQSPFKPIAL